MTGRLLILDRDGVINLDSDRYIKTEDEWVAIPGSLEAIGRLSGAGFRIVVISNQSGLGRGLFSIDDLARIHRKMHSQAGRFGGNIEAVFFCPHLPDEGCECRKPGTGLFLEVQRRLRAPLDNVTAVGDKLSDVQAARAAGASPVLVRSGYGQRVVDAGELPGGVPVFDDLAAVADHLLA